jgi:hypothetical protein
MHIARVVAPLVLLLCSANMPGAAMPAHVTPFSTVLTFPPGSRSSATSPVFRFHGEAYHLRLEPYMERGGMELVLERATRQSGPGGNLLDPNGYHGLQRWHFLASEYAHGLGRSVFGDTRTIVLPRRGLSVKATVVRAAVAPKAATSSAYRFTDLALHVVVRTLPVDTP